MSGLQIKHKLLLWFAGLVGALLLAFSAYVYSDNARFRQHTFAERLARKAEVTQQVLALNDSIAGTVLTSLPEQVEQVFAPSGQRIYTSQPVRDFTPPAALLAQVRRNGLVARFLQLDAENALERTNKKFIHRFTKMEEEANSTGRALQDMSLEEMDAIWNKIKKQ